MTGAGEVAAIDLHDYIIHMLHVLRPVITRLTSIFDMTGKEIAAQPVAT